MIRAEDLVGAEWAEWYRMTPAQRGLESEKLWQTYLALGGSFDPEPDTQSPFFDAQAPVRALLMGGQACVLYGAAEFSRDTDFAIPDGGAYDLLSLPDLVAAKKTQRDKDWPMIRRLLEADYFQSTSPPSACRVRSGCVRCEHRNS